MHLVVLTVEHIPWQTVRKWWRYAIGARGVLKTWISRIKGADGAARYICKYVSKVSSLDYSAYHNSNVTVGRAWGMLRCRLIPRHQMRLCRPISPDEIDFLKTLRKFIPVREIWWPETGFCIFGQDVADQVGEILKKPLADEDEMF